MKKIEKIAGVLGAAVLAAFLFISDEALAYDQFRGDEGDKITLRIDLPSYSEEERSRSKGYKSVKYEICTEDGTAKGAPWVGIFLGGSPMPGTDYIGLCGFDAEFTSLTAYTKYLTLSWPTVDDDVKENEEYFWIKLKNPKVLKDNTWAPHSGSQHVPSTIKVQVLIEDND